MQSLLQRGWNLRNRGYIGIMQDDSESITGIPHTVLTLKGYRSIGCRPDEIHQTKSRDEKVVPSRQVCIPRSVESDE